MKQLITAVFILSMTPLLSWAEEANFMDGTRQLTFEGKRAGEGYFSADGSKMIFQSERDPENPFYQIYLMDLETGDIEKVSPGHGKTTCAWIHPDGKRVMFASTQDDPEALNKQQAEIDFRNSDKAHTRRYSWDYDPEHELYEYDLETKTYTKLTDTLGYDAEGAYSPDGKYIVFASNRQAYDGSLSESDQKAFKLDQKFPMEIYIANADGSNPKRLTNVDGYDGGPFFSVDGKKICWRRFDRKGIKAEIYTMDIDGTNEQQLTNMGHMSWAPFFHPSGEYLIFATNKHGFANFELYLVRADGQGEPVRVTNSEKFDGLPTFSPDGNQVSWTSNRSGSSQIYLAKWDHQAARTALAIGQQAATGPAATEAPATDAVIATTPAITEQDVRTHVEYLASPELQGRLTGTEGEKLATAYAANYFKSLSLAPGGDNGTYFQEFEFTAGVAVGADNDLTLQIGDNTSQPKIDEQWRPISFSKLGEFAESNIVFAGYGIELPKDEYDSYFHLDVRGKWVMVMRYHPDDAPKELRQNLRRFSGNRQKANVARRKFAAGIIYVTGPETEVNDELVPMQFDASLADSGIPAITISTELATQLLQSAGKDFSSIQKEMDSGKLIQGFDIPNASIKGQIDVDQERKKGRNVIAVLESGKTEPGVLIGAHIDHLGPSAGIGSLAVKGEKDQIHFGADDNASGTAGVFEIAEYLVDRKNQGKLSLTRDVTFACWSGEEIGLLGSGFYTRKIAKETMGDTSAPLTSVISSYLNMDMIGRLDESVVLQGAGSSDYWRGAVERRNVPVGLSINIQNDVYLPTDAIKFYLRNVPILNAFTGSHADYHSPRDTPDKIEYQGARDIAKLFALIANELASSDTAPEFKKVAPPKNQNVRGFRVRLGTIPNYEQTDTKGVMLSGVQEGGPADKAGVKGGDIVIGLDGKELLNIYDYTDALAGLKVGEETDITVLRDGKKLKLQITPGSRE